MFKNEKLEADNKWLESDNKCLNNQVELISQELETTKQKLEHKHNELVDVVSTAFLSFRRIDEILSRNDYNQPEQKIRQAKEYAEEQKNYFANLVTETHIKNRTTNRHPKH